MNITGPEALKYSVTTILEFIRRFENEDVIYQNVKQFVNNAKLNFENNIELFKFALNLRYFYCWQKQEKQHIDELFCRNLFKKYIECKKNLTKDYIEIIHLLITSYWVFNESKKELNQQLNLFLNLILEENDENYLKCLQLLYAFDFKFKRYDENFVLVKKIIEKSILTKHNEIFAFITYKILPKYLECLDNFNETEQILHKNQLKKMIIQQLERTRNYKHLCCVMDYLITDLGNVEERKWFWEMIKNGLSDPNSSHRKSSLFLLKRIINIDPNQKSNDGWKWFVFLYETLDEKQSHIILPGLKSLASIRRMDPTWQVIIYHRLLTHDSAVIQRYAIGEIFQLKFDKNFFELISKDLIVKLNDMYLYQDRNVQLNEFFQNLMRLSLLDEFLLNCTKIKWQAVPYFHLCLALLEIDAISEIVVEKFIEISDTILNLNIRNASQCLLLKYLQKFHQISLNLLNLVQYLFNKCSIRMNSELWWSTVKWLAKSDFNLDLIDQINSSKIVLLLNCANFIKNEDLIQLLNEKLMEFKYSSTGISIGDHLNESFVFITEMLEEIEFSDQIELKQEISCLVQKSSTQLFAFIHRNIHEKNNQLEIMDIDCYLRLCRLLFKNFIDVRLISNCREFLMNGTDSIHLKYYWLSLLKIFIECTMQSYPEYICEAQEILHSLPSSFTPKDSNPNRQLISGYYKIFNALQIICIQNSNKKNETTTTLTQLQLHKAFESLECGGRESVSVTMELIQLTLPKMLIAAAADMTLNMSDIERLMSVCWNETMELKKCDLFWNAMQKFIQAFFTYQLLQNEKLRLQILNYGYMILENGQQMRGLVKLLFDQLILIVEQIVEEDSFMDCLILKSLIIKGLIFGTNLRKDERIEFETTEMIKQLDHVYISSNVENKYIWDQVARVRSIEIVTMILSRKTNNLTSRSELIDLFLNLLIEEYETNNRSRYYANSLTHLIKNRLLQALLLLQPYLNQKHNLKLFKFVCEILKIESPQPSVRYQLEWLLVLIIEGNCELIHQLKLYIDEFLMARISSLVSVISVTYHLTLLNPTKFFTSANSIILPLTMMSNFNVRLYAQVTFLWILEKLNHQIKYETIYKSLQLALNLRTATVCKPYEKLKNDFFLTNFHPIKHLTVETIYHDFPRLTLLPDEILDLKYFNPLIFFNLKNPTDELKSCTPISWTNKEDDTTTESFENDLQMIYQKKIIPLKITSELDIMMDSTQQKFQRKCGNLIVVASLVERAPNLGGLSRTCEIFGVEEFVINNLRQTESKEFQNLSVSSEKWLNIIDVPINKLAEYLFEMKGNGYTIVGCEQSTNSVQLTEFLFPKKTVLLLGNEKEGTPPNLLSIVDVCVEIPQCGVIRSLNVHVSGAITIWQYASQHLFKKI